MASPQLRFIHSSQLRLGTPVCGVREASGEHRDLVLRATLIAFERIITACVDHEVDFLLLTGNTFDDHELSVRAMTTMRDGFELLREYDIPVFLASGPLDPPSAWERIPSLPDNVVHLQLDGGGPVEVTRDGISLAELRVIGSETSIPRSLNLRNRLTEPEAFPLPPTRLFTIGVIPTTADPTTRPPHESEPTGDELWDSTDWDKYDCIIGRAPHSQFRNAATDFDVENTGPQGLSPRETGSHGCTLVEVDSDGAMRRQFLPTACIRFETPELPLNTQTTQDELLAQMREFIASSSPAAGEELVVFHWRIYGEGELFDALGGPQFRQDLTELCELESAAIEGSARLHHFKRNPRTNLTQRSLDPESAEAMLLKTLGSVAPSLDSVRQVVQDETASVAARWAVQVLSRLAESDEAEVVAHAQAMALSWLSTVDTPGNQP